MLHRGNICWMLRTMQGFADHELAIKEKHLHVHSFCAQFESVLMLLYAERYR